MGTPTGLRPARLGIGIISAGRVGTALGVALERAEHVVVACSAISHASRQRAERWLPDTPVMPVPDVAVRAELLLLTVPDAELAGLVSGLATTGAVRPGTIRLGEGIEDKDAGHHQHQSSDDRLDDTATHALLSYRAALNPDATPRREAWACRD